ncbi:MAG: SURF1 family protein [Burkholderiales bacterium]|nr:SURF1 family protein [Burkholderiales bacterium]
MTRLARRRWLILLATLVGVAVTARLGVWQLDRARQKLALQAEIEQRANQPALDLPALARSTGQAHDQQHRLVRLSGHWLGKHTVYLDNRPLDGRAGFIVVTPLLLAPGDAVLVQRGWVPRDAQQRTRLVAVSTPQGEVTIDGRVAPPPSAMLSLGEGDAGTIRQNLALDAFSREIGVALRPVTVQQLDLRPEPAQPLQRRWPLPAVDVAKNHGYAFQWFALSALIAGLYVWFQHILPRRRLAR